MTDHASFEDVVNAAERARERERQERDALLAENQRLRDALERCYQIGKGPHVEIAREALAGDADG